MAETQSKHDSPVVALLIIWATLMLMIGVGTHAIDLHFTVGPWNAHHWFSVAGAGFIALYTPAFYVLKRRRKDRYRALLATHVFGGLLATTLVAVHFTQHIIRSVGYFPRPGTGVVLFAGVTLSVLTGFLLRYRPFKVGMREWRLLHTGAAVSFFLTIGVHVLKGLGVF